jgi:hypothetical protein
MQESTLCSLCPCKLLNHIGGSVCSAGLLSSGQMPKAILFVTSHPEALTSVMTLSLAATVGEHSFKHSCVSAFSNSKSNAHGSCPLPHLLPLPNVCQVALLQCI